MVHHPYSPDIPSHAHHTVSQQLGAALRWRAILCQRVSTQPVQALQCAPCMSCLTCAHLLIALCMEGISLLSLWSYPHILCHAGSDRDEQQADAEAAGEIQQACPQLAAAQPDSPDKDPEAAYSAHQDRSQSEPDKPKQHSSLASRDEDCFQEAGADEVGFKFRGVSIPGRSRQTPDDLGSRLAVLRSDLSSSN